MSPERTVKNKNLEADVVVIGGGGAGLPAALTAVENGAASVIVLEKRLNVGGNAVRAQGIFACESHLQREAGVNISGDDIFKRAWEWHHYDKINPRVLRTFINKSADTIRWLEEKGVTFELIGGPFLPERIPCWHVVKGEALSGRFASAVKLLIQNCKDAGVQLMLRTAARKILRGINGNITGVVAEKEGKEFEIRARSVIIATGGFQGNKALLMKYFPFYDDDIFYSGAFAHAGDGVLMAAEAGAALEDFATLVREFGISFETGKNRPNRVAREPFTVWVNKRGKRFINETASNHLNICTNAILMQPGKFAYVLYDDKIVQSIVEKGWLLGGHSVEPRRPTGEPVPEFREQLQEAARSGEWIKISDSWDEIASWIGAEPGVLKATIDEYNSFCDRGYDETFVKDPIFLLPLRDPPYYAIKFKPLIVDTIGPIRINEYVEVLDKQDNPIPGLYAAGVTTSGWQSYDYCGDLLYGAALGFSISSGRIAGENAAKYVLGKKGR